MTAISRQPTEDDFETPYFPPYRRPSEEAYGSGRSNSEREGTGDGTSLPALPVVSPSRAAGPSPLVGPTPEEVIVDDPPGRPFALDGAR